MSSRRGSVVLRANVTKKTTSSVVYISFHFMEAAAHLRTIDKLNPQAKIPEFKACAVLIQVVDDTKLVDPEARLERGPVLSVGCKGLSEQIYMIYLAANIRYNLPGLAECEPGFVLTDG